VICIFVENKQISVTGKIIKIAKLAAEGFEFVDDPKHFIEHLRNLTPTPDIFTFSQKLPDTTQKFNYYMEWDNVAALPITTYEHWFNNQIRFKPRNKLRKSERLGVEVKVVDFNDVFAKGITNIYNESPIRQGKRFWHYGKQFETVKKENATFLDRSHFIGVYYQNELIGFAKLVYDENFASLMQIISMIKHRDKAPTNRLIAKSVEVCAQHNIPYLIYSKFSYGKKQRDTLSDFKETNGFLKIDIPSYYIPLSLKGEIALKLKLHHNILEILPYGLILFLRNIREKWYTLMGLKDY